MATAMTVPIEPRDLQGNDEKFVLYVIIDPRLLLNFLVFFPIYTFIVIPFEFSWNVFFSFIV